MWSPNGIHEIWVWSPNGANAPSLENHSKTLITIMLRIAVFLGTRNAIGRQPLVTMKKLIAIIALAVTAVGLSAQTAPTDRPANGLGMGLFNHRIDVSKLPQNLQDMVAQFRLQRHAFLDARKALFEQMKNMTEEQRKAHMEGLRSQNKDALIAQRQLAKSIRDELRKLREERRATTPGG